MPKSVEIPDAWRTVDPATLTESIFARSDRPGAWRGWVEAPGVGRKQFSGALKRTVRQKIDAFRAAQRAAHESGEPAARDRMTVGEYLDLWLAEVVRPHAPATYVRYEWAVRRYLKPALGAVRLRELQPEQVATVLSARAAARSPSQARDCYAILKNALNQARRWRLIGENPVTLLDAPTVAPREVCPLSRAQAESLVAAVREDRLEAAYLLGLLAGLRNSEVIGLRWSDLDLDAGLVHVRQGLRRITGQGLSARPTKSRSSRRSLALPAVSVAALRRRQAKQALERRMAGDAWGERDLVFTRRHGTPIEPDMLLDGLRRFTPGIGAPDALRFHDLRHTFATLLLSAGVPVHEVAALLGHADPAITLRTYAHFLPARHSAAARVLDGMFGAAGSPRGSPAAAEPGNQA